MINNGSYTILLEKLKNKNVLYYNGIYGNILNVDNTIYNIRNNKL